MNEPTDATPEPITEDKFVAFMKTLAWGAATFPVMITTSMLCGTVFKVTDMLIYYVLMIAVCAICGFSAGRNWTRVLDALISSLPISCGLGVVIWLVFGAMATLGQTPNAKWYGVPEGVATASMFLIASGVGAALRRSPPAA
jgi:hypothetical protein